MATLPLELQQLADCFGVQTSYQDVHKRQQNVSPESILAVLTALGAEISSLDEAPRILKAELRRRMERGLEPVTVVWDQEATNCRLTLPKTQAKGALGCSIVLEDSSREIKQTFHVERLAQHPSDHTDFITFELPLPAGIEAGYHQLTVESNRQNYTSLLISSPRKAYGGDGKTAGEWGCFLPLYSLRSERNWGAGDFTDLQSLMNWVSSLGGSVVGTLPLLAAFLDEPFEPSPYAPASRLAWNEFYVDIERIPELQDFPKLLDSIQCEGFTSKSKLRRESKTVDYREIMVEKRKALEGLAVKFFREKPTARFTQFQKFLKSHPHLQDYAEFRATYEQQKSPWMEWSQTMQDGQLSTNDYDAQSKEYHLYAQWIATNQLEGLAEAAGGGLYLDLPLGVRHDGYDVWKWRDLYAANSSAGSPPDAMWTKGQDWGFPPLHPERIREQGYEHVRGYLRHHLRLARILRVDHVMQLHRLYWVPHGLPASQGAYVQYHPDEFYAILALESHRSRTMLVGENLGTVPAAVNQAMDRHNLQRMYVVQYEIASDDDNLAEDDTSESHSLRPVRPGSLASMNTHDMASFAAWWRGEDLVLRQELDLINAEEVETQRQELENLKKNLTAWLKSNQWLQDDNPDEQQILMAMLKFLATSPAGAVLVNLEDLWLETEPQNVPGTGAELPNWKRKAALSFEEFSQSPDVLKTFEVIAKWRSLTVEQPTPVDPD
ncbi:MAG: 4-alpha-glucanotransferase [Planctomycetaceae bacterium]|nr:4-alpha-glucanotransferase [Planctomycetaceae bacterium]